MSSLQGKFISETYTGILHSDGVLPSSGKTVIYDGSGNASALQLGKTGNGATVTGLLSSSSLTVGQLSYPTIAGSLSSIVIQTTSSGLGLVSTLPTSLISNSGVTAGSYSIQTIDSLTVNSKGFTTSIETIPSTGKGVKTTIKYIYAKNPSNVVQRNSGNTVDWGTKYSNDNSFQIDSDGTYLLLDNTANDAKGAILYIQKVTNDSLADNPSYIRSSRSNFNSGDASWEYDGDGTRCLSVDYGTYVGSQITVSVSHDSSGRPQVWLRDDGTPPSGRLWKVAVQAFLY